MQLPDDFAWNAEKNELLKKRRGVSFEDVMDILGSDAVLETEPHPNQKNYPGQFRMYVVIRRYVYMVPFVVDRKRDHVFLKTIIPNSEATRRFLTNKPITYE